MSIGRLETTINGNYDNIDTQCARLSMWSNLFASPVTYITMMSLCSPKYLNDALIQLKPTELNWTSISTLMPCRAVPCRAVHTSTCQVWPNRMNGWLEMMLSVWCLTHRFTSSIQTVQRKQFLASQVRRTNQLTDLKQLASICWTTTWFSSVSGISVFHSCPSHSSPS